MLRVIYFYYFFLYCCWDFKSVGTIEIRFIACITNNIRYVIRLTTRVEKYVSKL